MINYIQFTYEGEMHIAFGEEPLSMLVYYQPEGKAQYVRRRQLRFPSWLKFVPEDEFTLIAEGEAETEAELMTKLKLNVVPEENAATSS